MYDIKPISWDTPVKPVSIKEIAEACKRLRESEQFSETSEYIKQVSDYLIRSKFDLDRFLQVKDRCIKTDSHDLLNGIAASEGWELTLPNGDLVLINAVRIKDEDRYILAHIAEGVIPAETAKYL